MFGKAGLRKLYVTFPNLKAGVRLRQVLQISRAIIYPTTLGRATAVGDGINHELFNTIQRAAETLVYHQCKCAGVQMSLKFRQSFLLVFIFT
jgi:hypothetical protein